MIINVFNKDDSNIYFNENKTAKNKIIDNFTIKEIQDYLIKDCLELLQEERKEEITIKINEFLYNKYGLLDEKELIEINNLLINKMFGYDILQKFIDDTDVTDIRVIKYNKIYVKRIGVWEKVDEEFNSEMEFEQYIRYCIQKNNSNINFDVPMVVISDKKYKLRIEAGIFPVNSISPNIVIRIHRSSLDTSLERLFIQEDMLDEISYKLILNAILSKCNIIISGKGGSGKTTLLRGIIRKIPDNCPITINEETTELFINDKNIIQREVIENREGPAKITLQRLMKHSLVMSNEVIVVGELKGTETTVFFDAISTGHMGLSTVHSDSAKNTIDRLVLLFKRDEKNQQYKEEFIKQILTKSIDFIIYLNEYKVVEIVKLEYQFENQSVNVNNVYTRKVNSHETNN